MLDEIIKAEIKQHNTDPAAIPWVKDFLQQALPPNPSKDLVNTLITIGCNAYNTTFIGDYDYSPDDLKLSRLRGLPQEQIDRCLSALVRKSISNDISRYITEFEEQENQPMAA